VKRPTVCLVNPQHPYLKNPDAQAPLGLLYVAASALEKGYDVRFVNLSSTRELKEAVIPDCQLYGITGTALDLHKVHDAARELKRRNPGCKVIVGGPITLSATKIDDSIVDSVVFGEGEHVFLELLQDWPSLQSTYQGKRISDLDSLPFPARHLLGSNLGGKVFVSGKTYYGEQSTVISTSRGCPCACTFCASPKIWGRKIIYRSAKSVIAEMREVIERHGVRQFRFSDDNLTCDQVKLAELCGFLQGQEVAWRASIRVLPNRIEMFKMMKAAGCAEVCFGIESGDPDVLKALKKGASVEDNRRAMKNAKEAGLDVRVLFMIGTPGQTSKTVRRNIDFFEQTKDSYDSIALTNFTPLPGCAIADDPEGNGVRKHDVWDLRDFNLCLWGPEGMNRWKNFVVPHMMTEEELTKSKKEMIDYVISTGKSNEG
jgi:anaerobic magnesium-protoporphyrin IX monomethyl ester cyclase